MPVSLDLIQAEQWYGAEPRTDETPERIFERRWAQAVMATGLRRLEEDCVSMGKGALFGALQAFLSSEAQPGEYAAAGDLLGID